MPVPSFAPAQDVPQGGVMVTVLADVLKIERQPLPFGKLTVQVNSAPMNRRLLGPSRMWSWNPLLISYEATRLRPAETSILESEPQFVSFTLPTQSVPGLVPATYSVLLLSNPVVAPGTVT